MKKNIFVLIIISIITTFSNLLNAQSIEESNQLISSEVKDGIYKDFSINSKGFLTFIYSDNQISETILTVDMTQAVITKEITNSDYRVWIKCIGGVDCINEKGALGVDENYYASYPKTYIPANSEHGMHIIYDQLKYLLKLGNTYR